MPRNDHLCPYCDFVISDDHFDCPHCGVSQRAWMANNTGLKFLRELESALENGPLGVLSLAAADEEE